MDASDQAAEQLARITLAGSEMALKLTGAGAKNVAAALMAAAASSEKTKGKTRLAAMLRSGKELKVFKLPEDRLKDFAEQAKRYGVLYVVVKQKEGGTHTDLLVRAEDASKVNRIIENLGLGSLAVEPADKANHDAPKDNTPQAKEIGVQQKEEAARLLDDLLAKPIKAETEHDQSPLPQAQPERSRSAPTSEQKLRSDEGIESKPQKGKEEKRESVRSRIRTIEQNRAASAPAAKNATDKHAIPHVKTKTARERH